jgi:tRNA nucleotidyltransferase/poly(A) polymerase
MKVPVDISEFHRLFTEANKDLFLVGGCVRDFKLGKDPHDFDMATNAYPEEIEKILKGYRFDLTGKNFGVIRVYTNAEPTGYEIATYREDETSGRKPVVKLGSTIQNDALRRDFTINALYYDISNGKIIDLVGGVTDLDNKVIRACGDPLKRIDEDALRMLRAVRFKNTIAGTYDESLNQAMLTHPVLECPDASGVTTPIAQERIMEEFLKSLKKVDDIENYINDLIKYDFVRQIFRNLKINTDFKITGLAWDRPEVLVADLLRDNDNGNEFINNLVQVCKFSKPVAEGVSFLIALKGLNADSAYMLRKRMDNKTKIKNADVLVYGHLMTLYGNMDVARMRQIYAFTKYTVTTDGDLLKANEGFKDGAELGAEIARREKENFLKLIENEK